MEIKTTDEIVEYHNKIDYPERCKKRWVAIDDLISDLEDWNSNELLDLYDIIERLKTLSKGTNEKGNKRT